MSWFGRTARLAAAIGFALVACSGAGAPEGEIGTAALAVVNVPSDVHCFRITAQGASRTAVRTVDVTPGQTVQASLGGLPTGQVAFTGEGLSPACASVSASSVPSWISDPVVVTVQVSPPVNVQLVLHPNGQAAVGADFQGDPSCFPAGSMCTADAECCTGTLCLGGLCSAPPCQSLQGACMTASDCCSGLVCTSGVCLQPGQCAVNSDCPTGSSCQGHTCVPAMCVPTGAPCGPAVPCCTGSCNSFSGICDPCQANSDCPATLPACVAGQCAAAAPGACASCNQVLPLALSGDLALVNSQLSLLCAGASQLAAEQLISCACQVNCSVCGSTGCAGLGSAACASCVQGTCAAEVMGCAAN
jgi:hypothetical protein